MTRSEDAGDHPRSVDSVGVGDEGPPLRVDELTRTDFVRYAGASGDFNPVHHDEPFAREAGNPSVFGQGMLVAAHGANFVTRWFGVGALSSFRVRFRGKVWPGDSLTVEGEVTAVEREGDETVCEVDVRATTDEGDVVLSGDAEVRG